MTWLSTSPEPVALLPAVLPLVCVDECVDECVELLSVALVLPSDEEPDELSSAVLPLGTVLPDPVLLREPVLLSRPVLPAERPVLPETVVLPEADPLGAADAITVRSDELVRSDEVLRSEVVLESRVGTPDVAPVAPPLATVAGVELSGCSVESGVVDAPPEAVLDDSDGVVELDGMLPLLLPVLPVLPVPPPVLAVAVSDDEPPVTIR